MTMKFEADLATILSTDKELVSQLVSTIYDSSDALVGRIIPMRGYQAGDGMQIKINTAGNTSAEVYTEGQTMPQAGQQTVITATFPWKHFRVPIGETLHARRARGPQGQGLVDGVPADLELIGAVRDLKILMNTTFTAASQTYSIDGIVDDSSTNFGDLSRATYTTLVSYVYAASNAALSETILNRAMFRSKASPYGSDVQVWISEAIQMHALADLQTGNVAAPSPNVGVNPDMLSANQRAFVHMPSLATGVVLGLTDVDGTWGYKSHEQGNLAVSGSTIYYHPLGSADSSISASLETSGAIYCTQPQRQVRIEGLSTPS